MIAPFNALLGVHFLRPLWLLGLLVLPLLVVVLRHRQKQRSAWQDAVDAHLLPHLLVRSGGAEASGAWAKWLGLVGIVLAIVAMAGPSLGKTEQPLWQTRQPLIIAADLSRAAFANDVQPSRLAQMRAKLAMLLRERHGGQVGLVVFAGDAFTVAPLTDDANNVALFLDALSPDVMPADGQRADLAIMWAQKLLQQAGFPQGDILLLTDHADMRAVAAAKRVRSAGYQVSALGVGTPQGGVFEGVSGLVRAQLDGASLQALASAGGGRYATLTATDADVRELGVLDPQQAGSASKQAEQTSLWRDDGYWLLPLVLLCWLPLFRRGRGAGLVLGMLCVLPILPAHAQAPKSASQGGLWQRADQAAYAQMQNAVRSYDGKNYAQAERLLQGVTSADGLYNLGNALAQQGRYDEAIAAYSRALKQQPAMADALYNRKLVEAAKQQKQNNQNKQGSQSANKQNQNSQQNQGQNQAQSGQQKNQQQPQDSQQAPSSSSAKAQDEQKQKQADAAQRERMQDALNQARQKEGTQQDAAAREVATKRNETPEQRERRLANQAWLQRVPDDPGALLRARFQLEARRRQEGVP